MKLNVIFSGEYCPSVFERELEIKYLTNRIGENLKDFILCEGVLEVHSDIPKEQNGRWTFGMGKCEINEFFATHPTFY